MHVALKCKPQNAKQQVKHTPHSKSNIGGAQKQEVFAEDRQPRVPTAPTTVRNCIVAKLLQIVIF